MAGRRPKVPLRGAPSWLITFSDLMCLLLTFFILLLSFSSISGDKFERAAVSMAGGFRSLSGRPGSLSMDSNAPNVESEARQAARKLQRILQLRALDKDVSIAFDALDGLKISLPEQVLFEPGQAALRPEALPLIQEFASVFSELHESTFEIHGNTDIQPLAASPELRDNYDLSYQRAHTVTEQLVVAGNLPIARFGIHANGASQPMATNDTEEGRVANRRVEIYVRGVLDREKLNRLLQSMEMDQRPATGGTITPPTGLDNRS